MSRTSVALQFDFFSLFPVIGESTILYIATDTNKLYRWNLSAYVLVGDGGGGTLAATLALGNTTGAYDIIVNTGQKIKGQSSLLMEDSTGNNYYFASSSYLFQQWYNGAITDFLLQGGGTQLYSDTAIDIQTKTGLYGFYGGTARSGIFNFTAMSSTDKTFTWPNTSGTVALTSDIPAPFTSPLTTKGDLFGFSTVDARLPVGTNTQVLTADSTQTLGVKWADAATGASIGGAVTSGTAGSVLFVNPDAVLAQNNQNFFYNNTLSRLSAYASLGGEMLTNGTFTGSASGWTVGSGYAYSANTVVHGTNGTAVLSQNIGQSLYREYICTFTISAWTVGTVTVSCGGITGTAVGANGTYTFRFVPTSTAVLAFTPTNTARFTIDTVSVKQLTGGEIRTGNVSIDGNWSNSQPGTTRSLSFNNAGAYTYTDYNFNGLLRASFGADSNGGFNAFTSGSNGFGFYTASAGLASNTLYSYNYPGYFYHQGNLEIAGTGQFGSSVGAGTGTSYAPTSTLQSGGGLALKTKRLIASGTLDNTATHWLLDATTASACTGTPSTATCSTYTGSGQTTCESHLPCTWNAGSSCGVFNNEFGMGTCIGNSGCSADSAPCSGGDQFSCESLDDSYGGTCAWVDLGGDCSVFDEATCSSYSGSGCSLNYADCSAYSDGGGDGATCMSIMGCSYDSGTGTCSGTYFMSCSGTYSSFSCTGTYYTGNCSGVYGTSCDGTITCTSYSSSGPCAAETGCSWSSVLNATLIDGDSYIDRTLFVSNDASGGADSIIYPATTTSPITTINGAPSYTLSNYKDGAHLNYFKTTYDCSGYVSAGTCTPTGCTINYGTCVWDGIGMTCSGDAACSGIGDQVTCEATTYFASCSGTQILARDWRVYAETQPVWLATRGGTGQSSYAIGDILYASTTTALSKLADVAVGSILVSGGVGAAPAYSTPVAAGIPKVVASANLTAQSAAIGATTLYAVPTTGHYRISWSATITTAATTSSALGGTQGLTPKYTSPTDSVVKTDQFTNPTISAGNTTGTSVSGTTVAYCKTGTNLQYLFGYTSVGITAMIYEIHVSVEYLR